MNRLLTVGEEAWLNDVARVIRQAQREQRGIMRYVLIREDLADEWVRRLEELTNVKP